MGQSRTVIGRESIVHHMPTMCAYNAPKPEQKTVQVRDSLTKLSYRQKPLPQLPKREGNSMNITVGNKIIWMFGSFGLCIEYIF